MATENRDNDKVIITMLEEIKSGIKNQKQPQIDLSKIESLTDEMKSSITTTNAYISQLGDVMEQARQPVLHERKITIDIVSKEITFLLIGMGLLITLLGSALYFTTRPNPERTDNDLKYRYIKMKGEATPGRISELENLFEINRDNAQIKQMKEDVEDYERAVKERVTLEEQNRLRQLEAEKLNNKAEEIKKK